MLGVVRQVVGISVATVVSDTTTTGTNTCGRCRPCRLVLATLVDGRRRPCMIGAAG